MEILVTGAAGFIGSTLVERLLASGHGVVGVDNFTDYYDPAVKRGNIEGMAQSPRFTFVEADLAVADLAPIVDGVHAIVHLAGQPGVRLSWADHFPVYLERNVVTTQRLLEQLVSRPGIPFLLASSSSVYGNSLTYPTNEQHALLPISPYGVTKAAAENVVASYAATYGLRTVGLRFFTVYGPRQRPDMATSRLISSALSGTEFTLFGDGSQLRDFTYVDDICRGVELLLDTHFSSDGRPIDPGFTALNLGGDSQKSVLELIQLVESAAGRSIRLRNAEAQPGDARRTGADIGLAREWLGWVPQVDLASGVAAQVHAARAVSAGH